MRFRVGILAFAMLATSACYRDSDDFNAKAAERMCRYNAGNPDNPFLDFTTPIDGTATPADPFPDHEEYGGAFCEEDVIDNLDRCSANCDYSPRKARRCLRKLRRAVKDGSFEDSALSVCNRVYTCGEVSDTVQASCQITTENCSVGGRGSPWALMLLLVAGGWSRRRRR